MTTAHTPTPLCDEMALRNTQITEKLLEAEEKKLRVLKAEIEASKHSDVVSRDKSKVRVCLVVCVFLLFNNYVDHNCLMWCVIVCVCVCVCLFVCVCNE